MTADQPVPLTDELDADAIREAAKAIAVARFQNPTTFYMMSPGNQEAEVDRHLKRATAAITAYLEATRAR